MSDEEYKPFAKKTRAIVATKNNHTDDDCDRLAKFFTEHCNYGVWGVEKGSEGTRHLQIYFELKNAMSYSALNKKVFPAYYHKRNGRPKQAAGYCKKGTKESSPDGCDWSYFYDHPADDWKGFEHGEISMQGKRTDIDDPVEMIVHEGATIRQVALEHPCSYVKYHKGFTMLRALALPPRQLSKPPDVIVLYGPTETGKTRDAHIKYWPDIPHYKWQPSNGSWWDNYDGEDKIIIDEFRGNMSWPDLLTLLDVYECRMACKGGFVNIQASKFVITSPLHPEDWYKLESAYDNYSQLERRITKIEKYEKS